MTKLQKDHVMILLESIDSKIQITMESVLRLGNKIDAFGVELNEDIARVSKRVDAVDKNLSGRIDAVHEELVAHRNDTELHRRQPKRSTLKKVA